jgi:nucleotide-binding universal stress UspA family protein
VPGKERRMLGDMRLLTLKTVLVATDLNDTSVAALQSARTLADAAAASLHVVHVPTSATKGEVQTTLRRAGLNAGEVDVHVVPGAPADAIGALAGRIDADVIVLGPHRERNENGTGRALGSTAVALQRNALAPCMIAARPLRLPLRRVLVAVALSDAARGALIVALSWASALRARATSNDTTSLTALSVQSPDPADPTAQERALDEEVRLIRKDAGAWAGIAIESVTVKNRDVAAGIISYVKEQVADLLVLGTRGLPPADAARLGSVSAAVTQQVDVPALLVPPAMWKRLAAEVAASSAAPRR